MIYRASELGRFWVIFLLLFVGICLGEHRQVSSDVRKYALQGIVIDSITSRPIGRALVEVIGQAGQVVLTDAEGRFHFENVPEGSAVLSVEKPGFVGSGAYRVLNRNQASVEVGPQQGSITLRLVPESVIFGQLVDRDGGPIEGARVSLVRIEIVDGRKQWLRLPINTTSDAGGNFRFAGLCSGSYYITVSASNVKLPFESDQTSVEAYPPLWYYPGNPLSSPNDSLELMAGQRAHVELALARSQVFRISGAVVGNTIARQYGVQLLDPGGDILPFSIRFNARGKFQIDRVPRGTYLIRAETRDLTGHVLTMEQSVNVNSDIADLQIPLQSSPGIPINVRTEFTDERGSCNTQKEGQTCSQSTEQVVTVVLHSATPFQFDAHSSIDISQGSPRLVVADVRGGEYIVSVRSSRGYVASVTSGGIDLMRDKLVIPAGSTVPPIDVLLRDGTASVVGNIHSEKPFIRAFVLLRPEFAPLQPPIVVNADSIGSFKQDGLAPGDYLILGFDTLQGLEYTNSAVLDRYVPKAGRISLSANQNAALSVNLIATNDE